VWAVELEKTLLRLGCHKHSSLSPEGCHGSLADSGHPPVAVLAFFSQGLHASIVVLVAVVVIVLVLVLAAVVVVVLQVVLVVVIGVEKTAPLGAFSLQNHHASLAVLVAVIAVLVVFLSVLAPVAVVVVVVALVIVIGVEKTAPLGAFSLGHASLAVR
jgi:hypothetical protein